MIITKQGPDYILVQLYVVHGRFGELLFVDLRAYGHLNLLFLTVALLE